MSRPQGIGLVSAIFLITVIAFLTVAITRTVRTGGESQAMDLLATRAYLAAETGTQLGVQQVLAGSCVARTASLESIGMRGCSYRTECDTLAAAGETLRRIRGSGTCSDGVTLTATRTVEAVVR